jgi:2-iminobutanoate/2-iminopropanoate deaminase
VILFGEEAFMEKQAISTAAAPRALGPYSQAVRYGDLLFISGQVGIDPESGKLVDGGVEAQTRQVLKNIGAVLAAAGTGFNRLLKTTVFLKDMAHFKTVNEIYAGQVSPPYPARAAVAVKELPLAAEVEIEAIAAVNG